MDRPIISNPWFIGKEKQLLRAQIARITHHLNILPNKNNFKINDEGKGFEPIDDAIPPSINDCLDIQNWVHCIPGILKEGRTDHNIILPEGLEDEEAYKKEYIRNDPFDPPLKKIINDKLINCPIPNVTIPAWKLSYCYDDKIYTNPHIIINPEDEESMKQDTSVNNTIVHLRSLTWPGGHIIRFKGQNQIYYFGWGTKYNDDILEDRFNFTSFPNIQIEQKDLPVGIEPIAAPEVVKDYIDNNSNM